MILRVFLIFSLSFAFLVTVAYDTAPYPTNLPRLDYSNCTFNGYGPTYFCYKIFVNATDWYSAQDLCQDYNGNLASVQYPLDDETLGNIMKNETSYSDFWMGANNNNTNHTWQWIDGTPFEGDYLEMGG